MAFRNGGFCPVSLFSLYKSRYGQTTATKAIDRILGDRVNNLVYRDDFDQKFYWSSAVEFFYSLSKDGKSNDVAAIETAQLIKKLIPSIKQGRTIHIHDITTPAPIPDVSYSKSKRQWEFSETGTTHKGTRTIFQSPLWFVLIDSHCAGEENTVDMYLCRKR